MGCRKCSWKHSTVSLFCFVNGTVITSSSTFPRKSPTSFASLFVLCHPSPNEHQEERMSNTAVEATNVHKSYLLGATAVGALRGNNG